MGSLAIMNVLNYAKQDAALAWHLAANHFPPVSPDFIPVAKQAIEAAVEAIEIASSAPVDVDVVMPNGVTKTLAEIVDELHLGAFIEARFEDEEV